MEIEVKNLLTLLILSRRRSGFFHFKEKDTTMVDSDIVKREASNSGVGYLY